MSRSTFTLINHGNFKFHLHCNDSQSPLCNEIVKHEEIIDMNYQLKLTSLVGSLWEAFLGNDMHP